MSRQCVIFSLLILFICNDELMAADSPCGDWEPYKDEKCFKIIDKTLRTYDDAEKSCRQLENSSTLPIIQSKDEQDFLFNLLFKTHKVVDNVWIGIKYTSNKFKWIDDSQLSFTNWIEGSPKNKINDGCVQMQSEEASVGKWIDEPCEKKNLVVCQKMQTWSLSRLQKTLLDANKELRDAFNDLKRNPVPVGFIYVQLPNQPEPKTLWSMVEWKDVTSEYAGLFFRAEGGGSKAFGNVQEDNSPRLTGIKWTLGDESSCSTNIDLPADGDYHTLCGPINAEWQNHEITRHFFKVSTGEVRPRNHAMRIWKRTK